MNPAPPVKRIRLDDLWCWSGRRLRPMRSLWMSRRGALCVFITGAWLNVKEGEIERKVPGL